MPFTISLTKKEIYHLKCSFEASFTDPESMNRYERSVQIKVDKAYLNSQKPKKKAVKRAPRLAFCY